VTVKNAATLAKHAEAVWTASPVEEVALTGFGTDAMAKLAACPYLARVRRLRLDYYHPPAGDIGVIRALLASPHLVGLRSLCWVDYGTETRDEAAALIANCPRLSGLEELGLGIVTEAAALALARSPNLKGVRQLHLRHTHGFSAKGVAELKTRFPD
jgi:hypothetical protein